MYANGSSPLFENTHLLRHRSKRACASIIYFQVDSVTKTLHCKAKYTINNKLDPTLLDAGNLILLSNLPKLWTLVWCPENRLFPSEYSSYRDINSLVKCPFLLLKITQLQWAVCLAHIIFLRKFVLTI